MVTGYTVYGMRFAGAASGTGTTAGGFSTVSDCNIANGQPGSFAFVIVTHYQRLLNYIVPDFVHVLSDGRIVRSGDKSLALELEEKGYDWIREAAPVA